MQRIYKALGIASAQDMRDQQASTASVHARVARLETDLRQAAFTLERVQQAIVKLQTKLDSLVAPRPVVVDALVDQVRDSLNIDTLVASAIERADIGGDVAMHLKHIDWSDEISIEIQDRGSAVIEAIVYSNR